MYCGEATVVKLTEAEREARVLKCRAWTCPDCQPRRRARLIAEAIGGSPRTFLTITIKEDYPGTRAQQAKALTRAWRLMRLRWIREQKLARLPFIAVMEATKKGAPHLHILLRAPFIKQATLSAWANEIIQSPIIELERIDAHRSIAGYCAKYCGKDPRQFGNSKRYWKSRDFELRKHPPGKRPREAGVSWERHSCPLWRLANNWTELGFRVVWIGSDRVQSTRYPGEEPP